MRYAQALAALDARQETRIELGLDRVRAHLSRLGNPQETVPAFHVAGTNGKGSTCAMLASVLKAAGYRTGLYVSPHLLSVRERISVDGRPIPEKDFARLLAKALKAEGKSKLTYFELLTSVAFQHFAESRCEVMVLETGLGGRLDATNVVRAPLAALVTSVDYDHQAFLGKTLPRIAAEKAGIFKRGVPALCGPLAPAALRELKRAADRLTVVRKPWTTVSVDWSRGEQLLRAPNGARFRLSLLGSRQGRNAALAHEAVRLSGLTVPSSAWKKGLASVRWPGRMQPVRLGKKTLIVDGAHNPEAARALAATWKASPWSQRPARFILGLMRDKDRAGVLGPLAPYLRDAVVVRPPSPRALDPLELAGAVRRAAPKARVTIERDPAAAIAAWRRDRGAPAVAVCAGSLYLAGAALKAVGGRA
ncbi:MAG: bifunctional folylpolyglutamate synthase/dihydrofolate synthase [Elusimicrobia bacterium]|nr:bifunctional folylpolyglutamate synthase/dihydrofolate synthase [Elusimicrobiota bacterium]